MWWVWLVWLLAACSKEPSCVPDCFVDKRFHRLYHTGCEVPVGYCLEYYADFNPYPWVRTRIVPCGLPVCEEAGTQPRCEADEVLCHVEG